MSAANQPDLSDPTQLAVKVTQIEGSLENIRDQVRGGIANLAGTLLQVQTEQKEQARVLATIVESQHAMDAHSQGLGRAFDEIKEARQDWSNWVKDHEIKNELVAKEVSSYTASINTLKWVGGVAAGVGSMMLAMVLYTYNLRMSYIADTIQRVEADKNKDVAQLQKDMDQRDAAVRERLKKLTGQDN